MAGILRTLALPTNPEPGEAGKQVQGHEARNIFFVFLLLFVTLPPHNTVFAL